VSSLPKTVTRQRRGFDLNSGPTAPESSTLTTRLLSHPWYVVVVLILDFSYNSSFLKLSLKTEVSAVSV